MKVLLINPTERRILQANLPLEIEKVRGKNQPVGLLYVAEAARRAGHEVRVLDAHAADLDMKELARRIADFAPDVVGLTCVTFNLPDVVDGIAAAKGAAPGAKILIGGMQPFLFPEETFRLPGVDGLLIGEAEESFPRFLAAMDDAAALRGVPGLKVRIGTEVVDTGVAPLAADLDALPMPAHDLLDPRPYGTVVMDAQPTTLMITSRGCPFQCAFCSRSITGKTFRAHGPDRVIREIRTCLDLGYRGILFYDETFTVRKARVLDICERIRGEGLRFEWLARGTVNTVDEEVLLAMKAAGCSIITFGVESGSPRVLERIKRPVKDVRMIVEAFRAARRIGLKTLAYFMVGNPDETPEDLKATGALMRRLDPDHVHVAVFVAYPATEFYDEGRRRGLFKRDIWREFSANPSMPFSPPTWPTAPSASELFSVTRRLYRRFYLRPRKIWQQLRGAAGWRGIKKRLPYLRALMGNRP